MADTDQRALALLKTERLEMVSQEKRGGFLIMASGEHQDHEGCTVL